jgi:glycosyltransferase involved in cell wall biosynthesis
MNRGVLGQMMNPDILVSIIIPVYNSQKTIFECLKSVYDSDFQNFEVIVIDDNSSDNSLNAIGQFPCRLIRMSYNLGPAAARNRGAEASGGEILFFLDSDIIIQKDTIGQIVETFRGRPEISALFCSYQKDTVPSNFYSQYKNLVHHYTHQNSLEDAATFCGGFGAIKRDIFFKLGGFDENYRSLEDMEFGYRLYQSGYKIFLNKEIQLTHCKEYTFLSLLRSDVMNRAIPWTRLMLEKRIFRKDLNLRMNNVLSVPLAFLMLFNLPLIYFLPKSGFLFLPLLVSFLILNQRFYRLAWKEKGTLFTVKTILMNWFSYLYSGVGLALGIVSYFKDLHPKTRFRAWT